MSTNGPLRVGVGGPVGTGKTALMDGLCRALSPHYDIAAITNDIYTKEDAQFLTRAGSLPPERILGIETGGCPHTAIREDASINLAGIADLNRRFPEARPDPDRERRRQPGRHLQPRAGRHHHLCHRRLGRRQDPAQGGARHHPQRPAGDQQDRPCPPCRRQPRGDGPRQPAHARRAALRVHQHPRRGRCRRRGRLRGAGGRVVTQLGPSHRPMVRLRDEGANR